MRQREQFYARRKCSGWCDLRYGCPHSRHQQCHRVYTTPRTTSSSVSHFKTVPLFNYVGILQLLETSHRCRATPLTQSQRQSVVRSCGNKHRAQLTITHTHTHTAHVTHARRLRCGLQACMCAIQVDALCIEPTVLTCSILLPLLHRPHA